jgi:predicted house-cleaning noncanonical NTP pyrophosphatase (MazG superfamily)
MSGEKLVRDKIVEFVLQQRGETLNTRIASEDELLNLIKQKILEEAHEVVQAKNAIELAEELGDLLEVIKALAVHQKIVQMMYLKKEAKYLERGGFDKGLVLIGQCKK